MMVVVKGVERELKAVAPNGSEWTEDLLGSYGSLHYERGAGQYTMTEDEFAWWEPVVEMINVIGDLEGRLGEDARAEYEAWCWPSDLDDEARARLEWLKDHVA